MDPSITDRNSASKSLVNDEAKELDHCLFRGVELTDLDAFESLNVSSRF